MPSPYLTPYAPSETYDYGPSLRIADLMGSMGRTRAEAFLRRGDIWGNAISQLGQLPLQIEQSRALSEQRKAIAEERRARTAAAQNEQQGRSILGAASVLEDPDQVKNMLTQAGRPDLIPSAMELLNQQMTWKDARSKRQRELAEADADHLARGARYLLNHLKDPDGGLQAAAMWADTLPDDLKQQAAPHMRRIQQDPSQLEPMLRGLIEVSPSEQKRRQEMEAEALKPRVVGDALIQQRPEGGVGVLYQAPPKAPAPPSIGSFEDYLVRRVGPNPTAAQITQARREYEAAGRKPESMVDTKAADLVADAWAEGKAFPTTQEATSAALESFARRGMPVPRKLSVGMQQEAVRAADTLETIQDVREAYRKVKSKVGPVSYRLAELGVKIPGVASDPDFVTFNTMLRGMGNLEIKRITGAQMSEQEASRLLKGMATGTLKPSDFEAALNVMERNAKRNRDIILHGSVQRESKENDGLTDAEAAILERHGIKVK